MFALLLLWVWFLYVVQHPFSNIPHKIIRTLSLQRTIRPQPTKAELSGCINYFDGCNVCSVQSGKLETCTKKICETPIKPKCAEYANTGIDLSHCLNYYDGCNVCSVQDNKLKSCTMKYCLTHGPALCIQYSPGTNFTTFQTTGVWSLPNPNPTDKSKWTPTPNADITNPASTNCINKWGKLSFIAWTSGVQVGICTLSDGTICEEQAYMRGQCNTTTNVPKKKAGLGNALVCTQKSPPVCAKMYPVKCDKPPCFPNEQQTFSNRCLLNKNKLAVFLHDGKCKF